MNDKTKEKRKSFHSYLSNIKLENMNSDEYIFHFAPKLLLPVEWADEEEIRLEMKGIDILEKVVLNRPYPNQRYVVAGYDKEGIISHGFYWVKTKSEWLSNPVNISLHWFIGEKEVTHKIAIQFHFANHTGNFFSSCQRLLKKSEFEQFEIITKVGESLFPHGGCIDKQVTLTHFPIEQHHYFGSDYNCDMWEARERQEEKKLNNISEVYYEICSSAEWIFKEENKQIIREFVKKGHPDFTTYDDDCGDSFDIELKKHINDEANEDWLFEKVREYANKYKLTEMELWKKYNKNEPYGIGFGIEIDILTGTIKVKDFYLGSIHDWNLSWDE